MGLESIIAQRIAAASQARERLYNPAAVGAALGQFAHQSAVQGAEAQQASAAQAADMEGVPAPVASVVADNIIPSAAPDRASKVAALVSSLGAVGGAKMLAKLAMYTSLFNANNRDALGRLKLGADLADGTLGKPPADPKVKEPRDPTRTRALLAAMKAKGMDTTGLSEDMEPTDIVALLSDADRDAGRAGVAGRAADRLTFDREKWAATQAKWAGQDAEALAAKRTGDFKAWAGVVKAQIDDIQQDINRMEVFEQDYNGKVTRKILQPEYYQELLRRKQAKEQELEAIKGEFVPPVPGASPPYSGNPGKDPRFVEPPKVDLAVTDPYPELKRLADAGKAARAAGNEEEWKKLKGQFDALLGPLSPEDTEKVVSRLRGE